MNTLRQNDDPLDFLITFTPDNVIRATVMAPESVANRGHIRPALVLVGADDLAPLARDQGEEYGGVDTVLDKMN